MSFRRNILLAIICTFTFSLIEKTNAVYRISLKDGYDRYYFYPGKHKELYGNFDKYYWNGNEIILKENEIKNFLENDSLEKRTLKGINRAYLKKYIKENIATQTDQIGTGATLKLSDKKSIGGNAKVEFSNEIFVERKLDIDLAVVILEKAIKENIDEIELPVLEKEPEIKIPKELQKKGINGIYSISKSDFSNSSYFRITNIKNALNKFNGIVIEPGEVFSFNRNLGNVDAKNGFVKELVIKSNSVEKEYGGGVCQVSTTLYRSIMEGGFEVGRRKNHSFAVNHYEPQGSDATIYLGSQDLTFKNNSSGSLILHNATKGDFAYFIILGNKKNTPDTKLFGPYISNYRNQPVDVFLPSTTLKEGQKMLLLKGQRGFTSTRFRIVDGKVEMIRSQYNAVPTTWKVGGLSSEKTSNNS